MTFNGLIEYGSNQVPAFFADPAKFQTVLDAPLDGTVIDILLNNGISLSTRTYDTFATYSYSDLSNSINYLRTRSTLGWGKAYQSMAKLQLSSTAPALIDWFDPLIDTVIRKMTQIGYVASLGGLYGVWFDSEDYVARIWTYSTMPQVNLHTFDEYYAQVYRCAHRVASAWKTLDKNMYVMFAEAYNGYGNGATVDAPDGSSPPSNGWGLYVAWLDAFYDVYGADLLTPNKFFDLCSSEITNGKLIPTSEITYAAKSEYTFIHYGYDQVIGKDFWGVNYRGNSKYFGNYAVNEFGAATWIDRPWLAPDPPAPFNPNSPNSNYFTPSDIEFILGVMFNNCDRGWLYDPDYCFYTPTNPASGLLPQVYVDAVKNARTTYGLSNSNSL